MINTTGVLDADSGYTTKVSTARSPCLTVTHSRWRGDFSTFACAQSCAAASGAHKRIRANVRAVRFIEASAQMNLDAARQNSQPSFRGDNTRGADCPQDCAHSIRIGQSRDESLTPPTRISSPQLALLVSREPARFSLAARARPVSHLARGNHAAANAHRRRAALLRTFPRALPECARACAGAGKRSPEILGGPRLLQSRTQFASRGKTNRPRTRCAISI